MVLVLHFGSLHSATIDRARLNRLLNNADSRLNEIEVTEQEIPPSFKKITSEQPSPPLDITRQLQLIFASDRFEPPLVRIAELDDPEAQEQQTEGVSDAIVNNAPLFRHQMGSPIRISEAESNNGPIDPNPIQQDSEATLLEQPAPVTETIPANFFESALSTLLKLSELSNETRIAEELTAPTKASEALEEEEAAGADDLPQPSAFHLSSSAPLVSFREERPTHRDVLSPLAHILGSFASESGPYRSLHSGFNTKYFI